MNYIDPETFGKEDIKKLALDIADKFNEFQDAVRALLFMLEESPNKFDYLELDCRYILRETSDAVEDSDLFNDVDDLLSREEEEENEVED